MKRRARHSARFKAFTEDKGDLAAAQAGGAELIKITATIPSLFRRKPARPTIPASLRQAGYLGAMDRVQRGREGGRRQSCRAQHCTRRRRTRPRSRPPSMRWARMAAAAATRRSANGKPEPIRRLRIGVAGRHIVLWRRSSNSCLPSPAGRRRGDARRPIWLSAVRLRRLPIRRSSRARALTRGRRLATSSGS